MKEMFESNKLSIRKVVCLQLLRKALCGESQSSFHLDITAAKDSRLPPTVSNSVTLKYNKLIIKSFDLHAHLLLKG